MAFAAIFDLDRTLIAGSSAEEFGAKLRDVGIGVPQIPGQSLFFRMFERYGEDPISMRLGRAAGRIFAGHPKSHVQAAGLLAGDVLARRLLAHAKVEIAKRKNEGAELVLATTSAYDLVEPLAHMLGFDTVLATRHRTVDDTYDGTIDGEYLWGSKKAAAVARWAADNDIDLGASWAYSDSFYDLPLLEMVGHPVAVNADGRLAAVATARRWSIRDFEHPDGVRTVSGVEGQELLFPFLEPRLSLFAKIELIDAHHLPRSGPVIIAANHRSYFDPFALGYLGAERGRPMRFMAKKEVLDAPILGQIATMLGTIRVDRGSGSTAPLDAAAEALEGGEAVVMLPQGTIPRGEDFFKAKLRGLSGVARLAQRTGAPIIPVGLWGTEHVWPRNSRVPRIDASPDRPTVTITAGEAYKVDPAAKPRAATDEIMQRITELLPTEAQSDRDPTAEELSATNPAET